MPDDTDGYIAADVQPARPLSPPALTKNGLLVLRRVNSGDPYRDKSRGEAGRAARLRTLQGLQSVRVIRQTREGFWRVTALGRAVLEANPTR
jgi:hypothetical protein